MTPRLRRAAGLDGLRAVAAELARALRPGDAVALEGGLGAGKTTLVAAVVAALHGSERVASPTFTIWQRHAGSPPVEHLDLYRLEDPAEAAELGLEEAFDPGSITFVEWPERLPGLLPADAVRVRIAGAGDEPRAIELLLPEGRP